MKTLLYVSLTAFFLNACSTLEGKVTKTLGDQQALVKLGTEKITVGDKVLFSKTQCRERSMGRSGPQTQCSKIPIGIGEVTQKTQTDMVVVKAQEGLLLQEGQTVERKKE